MQFIDLQKQYQLLEKKINRRIESVLSRGAYIMGPEVYELEEALAGFCGTNYCTSCANGTDALHMCLLALGIGPGDAVYTTPFTFIATAEVISLVGATPVFVDIEPDTFCICADQLEQQIKATDACLQPRAVIAVDLFGHLADYARLQAVCTRYDLRLIEDAAQGFGAQVKQRRAASFGTLATTSFFPAKPLGCYGDGGAIFTDDENLQEILCSLRQHGKAEHKYAHKRIGLNSRLDTVQAAVLLEKLAVFTDEIKLRNEVAKRYTESLAEVVQTPRVRPEHTSVWAQYTISTVQRNDLQQHLSGAAIPTGVYYPTPLHLQQAFAPLGYHRGDFPNAEKATEQVLSLPMHPYLSESDQSSIIKQMQLWRKK